MKTNNRISHRAQIRTIKMHSGVNKKPVNKKPQRFHNIRLKRM